MRRTVTGMALVMAAALLTGCGGSSGGEGSGEKGSAAKSSAQPDTDAGGEQATREVTFEVEGAGKTRIFYGAGTSEAENVTLPWTKTTEVTLKKAQLKVGMPVSIVPGSVKGDDGMYRAASCVIKVDGKKVADNDDGKSEKGCMYMLK